MLLPATWLPLAVAQSPAAAEKKPTIAVLTFDVQQGVTKAEAQILADRLAIELDRTGRFTLINRQRMAEQLALQKFSLLDACSASECAVEAGRILKAANMVYGSIGKVGDTFSLNTYLISVESGATLQSASADISGGIEEMLTKGIAENAARIAAPRSERLESGAPGKETCAVLTFDSRGGVSPDEVRLFSDRFAIELDSLRHYILVPRAKMEEVLKEQQFARSESCSAAECAIEAGKLLGVRYMAYGSIGLIGSLYTINTYLVDVESGVAVKTATTDFRGDKESVLTQGMRQNAMSLLGLEQQQGYLNIRVSPAHATLMLNGRRAAPGRIPATPNEALIVTAEADGYTSHNETHRVKSGETLELDIQLRSRYETRKTPFRSWADRFMRTESSEQPSKAPKRPKAH